MFKSSVWERSAFLLSGTSTFLDIGNLVRHGVFDSDSKKDAKVWRRGKKMTSISFWCEGGAATGFGHVSRSLALADAARTHGFREILFVIGDSDSSVAERIQSAGFNVQRGPQSDLPYSDVAFADIATGATMSDRETLDLKVRALRDFSDQIVWIDSYEEDSIVHHPRHRFDVVVTPYLGAEKSERPNCETWLAGAQFAVVRDCYRSIPKSTNPQGKRRLLLAMGGSDPMQLSETLLEATKSVADLRCRVVVGPFFSRERIEKISATYPECELVFDRADLSQDFAESDALVTAFGLTRYEAAVAEIPYLIISRSEKYQKYLEAFASAGIANVMFGSKENELSEITERVEHLLSETKRQSHRHKKIDGFGSGRVITEVVSRLSLRP